MFEQSLVNVYSANTLYINTCCSVIGGKLQLKHVPVTESIRLMGSDVRPLFLTYSRHYEPVTSQRILWTCWPK